MNRLTKTRAALLLAAICVSAPVRAEEATPALPVERQKLLDHTLAKPETVSRIEVAEIEFSARVTGIPHRHPCPVVGQILEGTIVFQIAGQEETVLHAGDAFFEPAETDILKFDNLGPAPARFLACYLVAEDDGPLVEMIR